MVTKSDLIVDDFLIFSLMSEFLLMYFKKHSVNCFFCHSVFYLQKSVVRSLLMTKDSIYTRTDSFHYE